MQARQPLVRAVIAALLIFIALPLFAAERQRIRVDDYLIDADLVPARHTLIARARVKFAALDDIATATFELHNALKVKRVLDEVGNSLPVERVTQDSTVRIALPNGLAKGATQTLIFEYEGTLLSADDSPVEGIKLASIGDEMAYLLYAGRWFPMAGYGTNRFTATMNVNVPAIWTVIGSGRMTVGNPVRMTFPAIAPPAPVVQEQPPVLARKGARGKTKQPTVTTPKAPVLPPFQFTPGGRIYTFVWDKPSFPGTILAGPYQLAKFMAGGMDLNVYFTPKKKDFSTAFGETAEKEFMHFSGLYGNALSPKLNVVEIPDDTVPSAWAPEIAGIASRYINDKVSYRLLANTIAHQWWGVGVSPASRDDWWLTDGFARYSEARYVESVAGQAGLQEAVRDMEVGALAYDSVPLSRVSTLDTFSPEFQSLTTDKGGVILHMLRWVAGDANFDTIMKQFYMSHAGRPTSVEDFQNIASKVQGDNLAWFFSQWMDSTGAPEFKNKYTVYRTNKGFRVTGEISQDLDLFRMPVELKIDTDGKSEMQRIEVVGTNSPYSVETFGKPRRITIDPNNAVLQNSAELKIRTSIMRGQQLVQQGDLTGALREFNKALEQNRNSSLAQYRIAEVFFEQRNYQAAANAYREALNGDAEPRWIEVWSHIRLGNIFDITGQRDRAVNEYRQAMQTNDNTQGALEQARHYLQEPYKRERRTEGD